MHIKAFSFYSYVEGKTSLYRDRETEVEVSSNLKYADKFSALFDTDSISNLLDARKACINFVMAYNCA